MVIALRHPSWNLFIYLFIRQKHSLWRVKSCQDWMHAAQTQAMRMCSRHHYPHEQNQRWLFCIFIRAPKITRSTRFWSWCWPGGWAVRFERFPWKKRSSARWTIFLVLSVTLFGTDEINCVEHWQINAGSFHFVLMLIHWNKNGEVSTKTRVRTWSQRRDFFIYSLQRAAFTKIALGHGKTHLRSARKAPGLSFPLLDRAIRVPKEQWLSKNQDRRTMDSFFSLWFLKFVFRAFFFSRSTFASPLKIWRIEPALRTEVQHARIHRLVSLGIGCFMKKYSR